jgi:predicted ATP-grasp superfamily ATP-dependent carboligase
LADGKTALLVGVTRQLVGEVWLHAAPFHYCGSIGPVQLKLGLQEAFTRLGTALVSGCGLVGLFGVDAILRDGLPWPVEVNPRYTASVEVLELTLNVALLTEHRKAFEQKNPASAGQDCIFSKAFTSTEEKLNSPLWADFRGPRIGKAILFAPRSFVFPGTPAWDRDQAPGPFLPRPFALADIPVRGTKIKARQPVFTLFFKADTETACLQGLKEICADLDRRFFGA